MTYGMDKVNDRADEKNLARRGKSQLLNLHLQIDTVSPDQQFHSRTNNKTLILKKR